MIVTLILLNSGEYLIAQAEELDYEPRCHLRQPYLVTGYTPFKLAKWPKYTDEVDILLHSTTIQTMCVPTENLLNQYLNKIGKTLEEIESPKQVVLAEDRDDYGNRDHLVDEHDEVMYIEE